MKKTLITAVFFLQSSFLLHGMQAFPDRVEPVRVGSAVGALIPVNYFGNEIERFSADIGFSLKRVKSGESTVDPEIANITENCRVWLDSCRLQINKKHMEFIIRQESQKQSEIQKIIEEKEKTIRTLQSKLNTLLSANEGLKALSAVLNKEMVGYETAIKRALDEVKKFGDAPELLTAAQLGRTTERLTEHLKIIKSEIKEGKRDLEGAFFRAQERYGDGIRALAESLEEKYNDILLGVAKKSAEKIAHLTEAYERRIEFMQCMADEAAATTAAQAAAKKTELQNIYKSINAKKEPFGFMASEVRQMDLKQRHETVKELYERFVPFAVLLGREDLGITARATDLVAIAKYRDVTAVMEDFYLSPDRIAYLRRNPTCSPPGDGLASYAHRMEIKQLEAYDKAVDTPFPSEEFSRLVEAVNAYFREFYYHSRFL
jgi:hypothetical protein